MRFRRMERRCAGVVAAGGVARGEMGEDSLDDLGSLDARDDDTQCAATHATVFDVDVEDSLTEWGNCKAGVVDVASLPV